MNRRSLLGGASLAATGTLAVLETSRCRVPDRRRPTSGVAVLRCESYERAAQVVWDGIRLLEPQVAGKRVLLKPNLVEYSASACINTHPTLIAATADALYRLGAMNVLVGDGPGHVRDSELVLEESGLRDALRSVGRLRFTDLNFDSVSAVRTQTSLTNLKELWLPKSLLSADVVVSMPGRAEGRPLPRPEALLRVDVDCAGRDCEVRLRPDGAFQHSGHIRYVRPSLPAVAARGCGQTAGRDEPGQR